MSKFKVTTKTTMFEEHIVEADDYDEAEEKALDDDVLSSKESTDNFGWEGGTDTVACIRMCDHLKCSEDVSYDSDKCEQHENKGE